MKLARLLSLVAVAAVVVSLAVASAASAVEPLFVPGSGTLTALTGLAKLSANNGVDVVECKESNSPGTIASPHLIRIVLHFLKCEGSGNGGETKCSVKSIGTSAENLILTETLHAIIGLILPNVPAVLILPTSGKVFVGLAGACIPTTKVTGSVTAEITSPIGVLSSTGKLKLAKGVSDHFISSLGNVLVLAELNAFSSTAIEETESTIDWGQLTEVT